MRNSERVVLAMSMKYAQRRDVADVADQLGIDQATCLRTMIALRGAGLVRWWPGDEWGLTSAGNATRNHLSSLPPS